MESPEILLSIYENVVHDKMETSRQLIKDTLLNKQCWDNWEKR